MLREKGVAALVTVLVMAAIILLIGLGVTSGAYIENLISKGQVDSGESFYAAEAGIQDALIKLARDKDFSSASPGYTLTAGGGSVTVIVEKDSATNCSVSIATGASCIISQATAGGKRRKIEVTVNRGTCVGGGTPGASCNMGSSCGAGTCVIYGEIVKTSWKERTN